jgi:hypothetical protein
MTITLSDDPIRDARRRTLARRTVRSGTGSVYYPPQFRDLSYLSDVRDPGSPIDRMATWYLSSSWASWALAAVGLALIAAVLAVVAIATGDWLAQVTP